MLKKVLLIALIALLYAGAAAATDYPPGREIPLPLPPNTSPAVRHFLPDIACGTEQCLAAWTAINDGNRLGYEIRGARISRSGGLLDATSFTITSSSNGNTTPPQVIALKSDYVVFYGGILCARVSRDGVVTARDVKTPISSDIASVYEAVAVGGSILVYSVENHGPLVPYVTLLNDSLTTAHEVKIDGQPTDVAVAGNGFVVASISVDGLKVTRLSPDGTIASTSAIPVWNASGVIAAAADSVLVAWRRPQTSAGPATTEFAFIANDGTQHLGVLDKSITLSSSLDVASTGNEYLVVWSRPSSGFYTDKVYARRISSAGQFLESNPVQVSNNAPFQIMAKCDAVNGGYLTVWTDQRYGAWHDHVFAATVSASGDVGTDFLVSRLLVSQSHSALATSGTVVATAWHEAAGDAPGAVLFTRAHLDGSLIDATPMRFTEAGGNPALTSRGDKFVVAWREFNVARVAIIDASGRVTPGGSITAPGIGNISIAAGPDDITVTFDFNNAIYLARVRYDGTVLDANPHAASRGADPKIGFEGQTYWLVYRDGNAVEARRVATGGTFLDAVPFTVAGAADGTHDQLAIACGSGSCAAVWRAIRGDEPSIDGAMLTTSGAVPGIVAARATGAAEPALTWNGTAYLVTWMAKDVGRVNFNIAAAQLSASGNLLGSPTSITTTDSDDSSPAVTTAGSLRVFAFSRSSSEAADRVYLRFDDDAPRRRSVRH